jgi:hypothetical protein
MQTALSSLKMDLLETDASAPMDTMAPRVSTALEETDGRLTTALEKISQLKERVRVTNQVVFSLQTVNNNFEI